MDSFDSRLRRCGAVNRGTNSQKDPRMSHSDRAPMKKAEQISSLLKQMLDQPGIGEQITRHQAWLVWDQLVGEQIAARARPLRLRKGVLEVQVDHPVWMQQLQMLKPKILDKINTKIPNSGITDIYLRKTNNPNTNRRLQIRKTPDPPSWAKIELTSTEKQLIEKELEQIDNPELRRELRRFFTLQKQLDKDREN
jgi:predicted nucleic acid-binding Zn ribbon protein